MPVRFTFPLDPLLKARRLAEQGHQRMVSAIERERSSLEESLRQHQERITHSKQTHRAGLVGVMDANALRMNAAATMHAMRQAQRVVLELAGVHKRLDAARTELIEASRRRRAVEILRERRFEEWKAAIEKAETAALDELAIMSAAQR